MAKAEQLDGFVESFKSKDVWMSLQASLQEEYEKLQIPTLPWLRDWELTFEQCYIDLTLKLSKDVTDLALQDIFQPNNGKIPKRILIEGPPGFGKSTLATKLCFDKANEEKYVEQFEAIILLRLREFEDTLDQLITDTLDLQDHKAEHVLEAIKINQSKVLFVLDGLDELHKDKHHCVIPLINGKRFQHSTVVVTSRLGSMKLVSKKTGSSVTNILHCIDRRVEIHGVTGDHRIQFLRTYLNHSPEDREEQFNVLLQGDLFDCPLYLLLLVIVAEESDVSKLTTKTELYKTLFNFILRRMYAKEAKLYEKCDFFDYDVASPPTYVLVLSRFGAFVNEGMADRKYSFTVDELRSRCGNDDILRLGILTQNDCKKGVKRKTWFEAVHLTFFEFSVAYHAWVCQISGSNTEAFLITRSFSLGKRLTFLFLTGLYGKQFSLICGNLGNGLLATKWLKIFIDIYDPEVKNIQVGFRSFYNQEEVRSESQLDLCDIGKALVSLISPVYILNRIWQVECTLLKTTLMNAVQRNGLQKVVVETKYSIKSCDHSFVEYNTEPEDTDDSEWLKKVLQFFGDIVTHQNLLIVDCFPENDSPRYKFEFTICEAVLEMQRSWLSDLIPIESVLIKKPIHKISYMCFSENITEIFSKLSSLIRDERVESLKIDFYRMLPQEAWNEFFCSVKQSKRLANLEIQGSLWFPLFVDFSGSEDKKWKRIELQGNVIPEQHASMTSAQNDWDVDKVIKSLPITVQHLQCEKFHYDSEFVQLYSTIWVFEANATCPLLRDLRELQIRTYEVTFWQPELNFGDLSNLQVLAIDFQILELSDEQEDMICAILMSMVLRCHPRLRLEFWSRCSDDFVSTFLQHLNEDKYQRFPTQDPVSPPKLDTLLLSHVMKTEVWVTESTRTMLKKLLKSGQLGQLWISGTGFDNGYATSVFVSSFPSSEGFQHKLRFRSAEETRWWSQNETYDAEYYISIAWRET